MDIIDQRPSWDKTYMTLCYIMAMRSPDESTKVGCAITNKDNILVAMGLNGLPRGIENEPQYQERPGKYFFFEHAERNAFFNSNRTGVDIERHGHTLYITWVPCADCARAILQEGVKEVVIHRQGQEAFEMSRNDSQWGDGHKAAMHMLQNSTQAPNIRWYDGDIITDVHGFFSGKIYDFVQDGYDVDDNPIIVPKQRLEVI